MSGAFCGTRYLLLLCFFVSSWGTGYSQKSQVKGEQYLIGAEEKLEMIVHVWGEIGKPGEYRVSDDTNVLELISKAGGTTEFSNIREVILTREGSHNLQLANNSTKFPKRVIKINLKEYLEKEKYKPLPKLHPGDVITVKRNKWYRWQTVIRLAAQIAIVVQAAYYFSRINQ